MLKPIRDPLLCATPSQSFLSTARLLTHLASFYQKETELVSPEQQIRNVQLYQLSCAVEAMLKSDYPFVTEGGDFSYVVNMATFTSHDHQGSRKWRKVKVMVYDPERAALIQTHEINIPLCSLGHDNAQSSPPHLSHA